MGLSENQEKIQTTTGTVIHRTQILADQVATKETTVQIPESNCTPNNAMVTGMWAFATGLVTSFFTWLRVKQGTRSKVDELERKITQMEKRGERESIVSELQDWMMEKCLPDLERRLRKRNG